MARKVYVEVTAKFDETGLIMPLSILWEDGRQFDIDKVLDIRKAAALKAGGAGVRYTCRIGNTQSFLFLEESKWFVEAKS